MKLLAWRVANAWTQFHILALGVPLCGAVIPDVVQRRTERPARIRDWPHTCLKCRQLAQAAATDEEPPTAVELAFRYDAQQKPADRGQAIDGLERATGAAGPVDLETITAGQERVAT